MMYGYGILNNHVPTLRAAMRGGSSNPLNTSLYAVYKAESNALASLTNNLYAVYKGESNATDSVSGYVGTPLGGLTYSAGKSGNAFTFNGTSSYVALPNDNLKFISDFSISFWYKTSSSSFQSLIDCYSNSGGQRGWAIQNSGTNINFKTWKDGVVYTNLSSSAISTNTWYHICIVRKSLTSTKMYLNGTLSTSDSVTTDQNYLSNYSLIGAINDSGGIYNYTSGQLDEISAWSKELSATEITDLYNVGNGKFYQGNAFYSTVVNDSLATYNGTAQGGLTYSGGKSGNAFTFNGTDAYVQLPNNTFNLTGDFSFSLWVNLTNLTGLLPLINNFDSIVTDYRGVILFLSGTTLYFRINYSNATPIDITYTYPGINQWIHIVATRKVSTRSRMYINGTLVTNNASTINPTYYTTMQYNMLGAYHDDSGYKYLKNGDKIDEVNAWNKELTATEVTELYNTGTGKFYPY